MRRWLAPAWLLAMVVVASCAPRAMAPREAASSLQEAPAFVAGDSPAYGALAPEGDTFAAGPAPDAVGAPEQSRVGGQAAAAQSSARYVISQAQMTLLVEDVEFALIQIEDLALTLGGFISNSQLSRSEGQVYGLISIRVPADGFKEARRRIRNMSLEVVADDVSGQDVTEEFTDLQSNLRNLQATEAELLQLLTTIRERTQSAAEVLTIFNELKDIRAQIEQVQGRINYLDNLVTYATLTVQVMLPQAPEKVLFTGEVESVEGETFVVNEITVVLAAGAEVIGEIEEGALVEVKGMRQRDGTVSASRVQVAESLSGEVESIENRGLIINGVTVLLPPGIAIEGMLEVGAQVEVLGFYEEDGSLRAARVEVTEPAPSWDPGRTLRQALERLGVTARGVANGAIWVFAFGLPVGLMVGAPFLAAFAVWRLVRRRRPGSVAAAPAGDQAAG